MHSLRSAVDHHANLLHIRFPHFIRSSVRMAHLDSEMSALSANIAFRHNRTSFFKSLLLKIATVVFYQNIPPNARRIFKILPAGTGHSIRFRNCPV